MSDDGAISSLMFFTLGVVLIGIIVLAIAHLRKRSNRHPMRGQRERSMDEMQDRKPPR